MDDIEAIQRVLREHPLVAFSVYTHIQADTTRRLGRDVGRTLDAAFENPGSVDGAAFNQAYGQFWLWVLAAYEVVRTMCQSKACFSGQFATKLGAFKKHVIRTQPAFGDRGIPRGQRANEAVEQADAADEGRSEPSGSIMVGKTIVNQGRVVRPSQLVRSVGRTWAGVAAARPA